MGPLASECQGGIGAGKASRSYDSFYGVEPSVASVLQLDNRSSKVLTLTWMEIPWNGRRMDYGKP